VPVSSEEFSKQAINKISLCEYFDFFELFGAFEKCGAFGAFD